MGVIFSLNARNEHVWATKGYFNDVGPEKIIPINTYITFSPISRSHPTIM